MSEQERNKGQRYDSLMKEMIASQKKTDPDADLNEC